MSSAKYLKVNPVDVVAFVMLRYLCLDVIYYTPRDTRAGKLCVSSHASSPAWPCVSPTH